MVPYWDISNKSKASPSLCICVMGHTFIYAILFWFDYSPSSWNFAWVSFVLTTCPFNSRIVFGFSISVSWSKSPFASIANWLGNAMNYGSYFYRVRFIWIAYRQYITALVVSRNSDFVLYFGLVWIVSIVRSWLIYPFSFSSFLHKQVFRIMLVSWYCATFFVLMWEAERVCWRYRGLHQYHAWWQTKSSSPDGCHVNNCNSCHQCICCRSRNIWYEHHYWFIWWGPCWPAWIFVDCWWVCDR